MAGDSTDRSVSPPRRRRRLRPLILAVLIPLVALGVAAWFGRIAIGRAVIDRLLLAVGVDHAQYRIDRLGVFGMTLSDVRLGSPEWLQSRSITIGWSPLSAIRGRAKTVEFADAHWRVRVRDGQVDWGLPVRPASPPSVDPLDLRVNQIGGDVTVDLDLEGVEHSMPLAATVRQTAPGRFDLDANVKALRFDKAPFSVNVPDFAASLSLDLTVPSRRAVSGGLKLKQAGVADASRRIVASGIDLDLPVRVNGGEPKAGKLRIGSVSIEGVELPGLGGEVSLAETTLAARIDWPIASGVDLRAETRHDLAGKTGEATATMAEASLADAAAFLAGRVPALRDATLGGTLSLDARASWTGGEVHPLIRIVAKDVAASSSQWSGSIDGLSGDVTIHSLNPIATGVGQEIRIAAATVGDMRISDARLVFTLESAHEMLLERATWSMGDMGVFSADPVRFDPIAARIDTSISGEGIGLAQWLPKLSNDRVHGDGKLVGRMNLHIDPRSDMPVRLGEGYLEASQGTGFIQTTDTELIEQALGGIDSPDIALADVRQRIMNALQDFAYSDFKIEFSSEPDEKDLTCIITTKGRGRTGRNPIEIGGVTLIVHDFNWILDLALDLGRELTGRE